MRYLAPLLLNLLLLLLCFFRDIATTILLFIIVVNITVVPVYLIIIYYKSLMRYSTVKKTQMLFAIIAVVLGCGMLQFLYSAITAKTLFAPDSITIEIIYQTTKWGMILVAAGGCIMNIIHQIKQYFGNRR